MFRILLSSLVVFSITAPVSQAISRTMVRAAQEPAPKARVLNIDFEMLEALADQNLDRAIKAKFSTSWLTRAQKSRALKIVGLTASAAATIYGVDSLYHGLSAVPAVVEHSSNIITHLDDASVVINEAAHIIEHTSEGIEVAFGTTCVATSHKTWNMMFDAIKTHHGKIEMGVVTAIGAGLFLGTILWTGPTAVIILGTGKALFVTAKVAAILYASYTSGDKASFKNFYLEEAHTDHMTFTDNLEYSAVKNQFVHAFEQASADHKEGQRMVEFLEQDLEETEAKRGFDPEYSDAVRSTLKRFAAVILAEKQVAAQRLANADSMEYHYQMVAMKKRLADLKEAYESTFEDYKAQKNNQPRMKYGRLVRFSPKKLSSGLQKMRKELDQMKDEIELLEKGLKNFRKPKTTLSTLLSSK